MHYKNICMGVFLARPNRFIAQVRIGDEVKKVHVKNTGRCQELLYPGVTVVLEKATSTTRKTEYDLIAVYKDKLGLVNIDSQAPNKVVGEWLKQQEYSLIRPEYTYGNSRIDFYLERSIGADRVEKYLLEVKGCTLEKNGIGYFPDAPTDRGVKHLRELARACGEGYKAILAYVIQMEGITEVRPNIETHPAYGKELEKAIEAGVKVLFLTTRVNRDSLVIDREYYYE